MSHYLSAMESRRLTQRLLWPVLIVGGLAVGGTAAVAWHMTTGLPSLGGLRDYQPSLITKIKADNRQVIGQYYVERRILTPLRDVPQHLIDAVIAVEDTRFFEHPGLDVWGILRATWTNFKRGGKVEGASTITQQLARSLFLTPERTFQRKIRELFLALKMEFILTKEQILEMYLNQIYFGQGAYGVGTASLTYFGKMLSELQLPESAFLAGLLKAPNTYSPYKNYILAKKRQEHVLGRMVQAGFLTESLARAASGTRLDFTRQSYDRVAPYFLEDVRQHLVKEYGEAMTYKGGLQVSTTLNIPMQRLAEEAIRKGLRDLDKRQGWRGPLRHEEPPETLPAEPPTVYPAFGEILEGHVVTVSDEEIRVLAHDLVGTITLPDMLWAKRRLSEGASVTDAVVTPIDSATQLVEPGDVIEVSLKSTANDTIRFRLDQTPVVEGALIAIDPRTGAVQAMVGGYEFERSQFNRAFLAIRQPGSAFKPIIYATAIDQGLTPATLILDAPVVYEEEEPGKTWKPENYERRFFGPITLREALRHSRNAATVRLLEQIGVPQVINFSRSLGIRSPLSPDLSLALGSSGVTLEELTATYGVFANQGLALRPYTISLVKDQNDHILEHHVFEPRQAISKQTAYLTTHMLMDVIQSGTGKRARSIGRPLAGKTGTTNSFRDAWFVGYAPNLATGVWVGFDGVETLGKLESGAHAALPIWTDFMSKSLNLLPVQTFSVPDGIEFVEVDQTTGTLVAEPSQETTTEVFADGTVPHPPVRQPADPLDFYEFDELDQAVETR
ncbi:MAG: PBP1A family penicillin-binding protein [Nitrospira sp.]|nr:PBP1A family penicillin-binding protein [Nitrospira sp.]MCY3956582.1 PBP1A family penicillin-binding protein [Nitrospira sp.]